MIHMLKILSKASVRKKKKGRSVSSLSHYCLDNFKKNMNWTISEFSDVATLLFGCLMQIQAANASISAQVKQFDIIKRTGKGPNTEELNRNYLRCWQILERMINQNIYDEIALGL